MRGQVSSLLCRIAAAAPHLLAYQAVVAGLEGVQHRAGDGRWFVAWCGVTLRLASTVEHEN